MGSGVPSDLQNQCEYLRDARVGSIPTYPRQIDFNNKKGGILSCIPPLLVP